MEEICDTYQSRGGKYSLKTILQYFKEIYDDGLTDSDVCVLTCSLPR